MKKQNKNIGNHSNREYHQLQQCKSYESNQDAMTLMIYLHV